MSDIRLTAGISLLVDAFWARVPEGLRAFPRDLARASFIALACGYERVGGFLSTGERVAGRSRPPG